MTTYKQIIYDGGDKVLVDMAKKAQKLNTARNINVTDADGTHSGTAASFDGSGDVNIKLPATISADITGNAQTATSATSAGHQTTADSATSAGHATSADSATSAGTAASASEAAKLSTARSIKTDLASGTAASFDGSADVTPGISGVLPIQNGGTGSATKNFCDLNNQQNIGGSKTFTANEIYFGLNKEGHIVMRNDNASLSTVYSEIIQDSNNKCRFLFYYRPTGLTELNMVITKAGVTTTHVIQTW